MHHYVTRQGAAKLYSALSPGPGSAPAAPPPPAAASSRRVAAPPLPQRQRPPRGRWGPGPRPAALATQQGPALHRDPLHHRCHRWRAQAWRRPPSQAAASGSPAAASCSACAGRGAGAALSCSHNQHTPLSRAARRRRARASGMGGGTTSLCHCTAQVSPRPGSTHAAGVCSTRRQLTVRCACRLQA